LTDLLTKQEDAIYQTRFDIDLLSWRLERATQWLLGRQNDPDTALAGATPYLRLFALAAGGAFLAEEALAASRMTGNGADAAARIAIARYFAENLAVAAGGLERTVVEAADSINSAEAALA
jgi:hypothetical protein